MEKLLTMRELGPALGFRSYDAIKHFIQNHADIPHILTGANRGQKLYRLTSVMRWLDKYETECTKRNIEKQKNK